LFSPSQTVWYVWHAACKYLSILCRHNYLTPSEKATLEIEFMHQTLSRYVTPSAAKTLSDLYNKISQAYARRAGDENLQSNLDGVKKTLAETRRATGIEFLCFRQTKDRSGSASGASGPRTQETSRRSKENK
jgi:exocyst complex component 2